MNSDIAIKVEHVSKEFKLPHEKQTSVKGVLLNLGKPGKRNRSYERQLVLNDVSFEIKRGEFFGIVGRNGSGKSTLLKMLAGIYTPTSGEITVTGKLTPFIELGVGFNPELTGRENVFLNGALLGFNREEMSKLYTDIVAFAELERFMDQKLKNYSSGMQVRLAFSIAIRAQTDMLILDEVLAVGDAAFQKKCYDHFMLLKKNKQTVVLVTHDMGAVRQYCDRAVMIENGVLVKEGLPNTVAQAYHRLFLSEEEAVDLAEKERLGVDTRKWGNGAMKNSAKVQTNKDSVTIKARFECVRAVPDPLLGFTIYGPSGNNILEGNTQRSKIKTEPMKPGDVVEIAWTVPNLFANGRYDVSVASCNQGATEYYQWFNEAASFKISKETFTGGAVDPPVKTHDLKLIKKATS